MGIIEEKKKEKTDAERQRSSELGKPRQDNRSKTKIRKQLTGLVLYIADLNTDSRLFRHQRDIHRLMWRVKGLGALSR